MYKSRRITIELIERDPEKNKFDYGCSPYGEQCDENGLGTRIEMSIDSGTEDTNGCQTTREFKKGHIGADEAAKIIRKMFNETSTKKKFLMKSLKGKSLFGSDE